VKAARPRSEGEVSPGNRSIDSNLGEVRAVTLEPYPTQQQRLTSVPTGTVVVTSKPTTTAELQAQKLVNYQHRVQQQQEIRNLSQQQWSQKVGLPI
jgi:ribosome-binding protein aMBF1 (putative translation factor)